MSAFQPFYHRTGTLCDKLLNLILGGGPTWFHVRRAALQDVDLSGLRDFRIIGMASADICPVHAVGEYTAIAALMGTQFSPSDDSKLLWTIGPTAMKTPIDVRLGSECVRIEFLFVRWM